MTNIKHILLVPERDDPHRLLAEGRGGARPPIAYIPDDGWEWEEGPCTEEYPHSRALILAWDGKPVQSGLDKATSVATWIPGWWVENGGLGDRSWRFGDIVQWVGRALAELLNCTLVLIDAEGQVVKDA